MKKTEIVFILDRSGSMSGLEDDTIGGYNSMLKKQQEEEGEARITTVLFDNEYKIIHDRGDIKEIRPLTSKEYYVRGTTALLDAIGITINKIVSATKNIKKEYQADKVMFVIITDGMENSSQEYTYEKVKKMIEKQKQDYKWEFIFLGANIDAVETASRFGIAEDRAANYHADSQGTALNYNAVSEAISDLRMEREVRENWKAEIDKDYETRSGDKR
nr:vWA domain-containing protein [Tissierella sp.]